MSQEPSESTSRNEYKLLTILWSTPSRRFLTVFVSLYFLLGAFTLGDYGMTWDESWENYYGDKTLSYYFSFNPDHLDFDKNTVAIYDHPLHPDFHFATTLYRDNDLLTNPHLVWPVAPVLSSACKYLFFNYLPIMTVVDAHHLAPLIAGLALAISLFFFMRTRFGVTPAAFATVALSLYPRWWAHCHFNPKDVISTLLISLTIFAFVQAVETRRVRYYTLSALFCGLAVSCKANALFLPFMVLPFFAASLVARRRSGTVFSVRESLCWVAYPGVALTTAFACWPLMWIDFPTNLGKYWNSLVERGYTGSTSWNAVPLKYALATMPMAMIVLLAIGIVLVLGKKHRVAPLTVLLFSWMLVPLIRVCVPGAKDFDGIRHWLEVLPPACALMGLGAACCWNRLRIACEAREWGAGAMRSALVGFAVLCFLPQLLWMTANHPHQLTFFNPLVGRLSGARSRGYPEATDYWGSSYRQGVEWLNAHAEKDPFVTLEVAEHLAFYYFDCIVDEDVLVRPIALMEATLAEAPDRPYYLMTIVRPEWQKQATKSYHAYPIVHRITVDGADILQIRRIDGATKP